MSSRAGSSPWSLVSATVALLAVLTLVPACDAPAQPAGKQAAPLAWMPGHWRGSGVAGGRQVTYEYAFTSSDGKIVVGAAKEMQADRVTAFFLVKITHAGSDDCFIDYYWSGEQQVRLMVSKQTDRSLEFSNDGNVWPTRVSMDLLSDGSMRWKASGQGAGEAEQNHVDVTLKLAAK